MLLSIIGVALILIAVVAAIWWWSAFSRACNPPLPRQSIRIGSNTFDVEMATTMVEQACGLSGRSGLGEDQGMLFSFGSGSTQSFWMKDMQFPLDMIWISQGKVAGAAENVDPQIGAHLWELKIYTSPPNVDTVLEVPAGTVAKRHIQVGDLVTGL